MTLGGPVGLRADTNMKPEPERWIRSQRAAVADAGDHVYLVGRDGSVRRIEGDSAELARTVLAFVAHARSTREILEHVESLAGPLGEGRAIVEQLVDVLAEAGAITKAGAATEGKVPGGPRPANIVVAVSGAIAATHAPALVAALQRRGHTEEVAVTQTAQRFVAVDALAAIAGREIHTTLWPSTPHAPVPHVALASWADLVIVYPASATTLGRLAHGDFSDLVSAIALTTRAPVVVVPSMNVEMLAAPAVQRNLAQLRDDGVVVLHGVPSQEVADAPQVRGNLAGAAPAPGEVAATVDALRTAGALSRARADRGALTDASRARTDATGARTDASGARTAVSAADWDAIYRAGHGGAPVLPWASTTCDADIAALLTARGRAGGRLLDVGCGLGQVARHAAAHGYRVVASDLSETALHVAREHAVATGHDRGVACRDIVWVQDDICATRLCGPFDVIVDRATLHSLPAARVHAWAQAMRRLTAPGSLVIVKAHRDGVAGVTSGWTAEAIAHRLPDFELVDHQAAVLPGLRDSTPIASTLVVLRRHGH
jgi:2-polyprenyl-3-methyl-5-hydroxy-6-metoxy-1,4-benzoquinol methylase/3-polyprenyl-4-hydroxybenzoate decarboxylase